MHEISRRIWDRGLNVKKWSALNNFSYSTVQAVIFNKRGKWQVGKCEKILNALVSQGFMSNKEKEERRDEK